MTEGASQPGGEVALFEAPDGQIRLDVRLGRETVWLSLNQMAELFGRDKSVISRHLRHVFTSKKLGPEATVAKNATTAIHSFAGVVEYIKRKAAETAREPVL